MTKDIIILVLSVLLSLVAIVMCDLGLVTGTTEYVMSFICLVGIIFSGRHAGKIFINYVYKKNA